MCSDIGVRSEKKVLTKSESVFSKLYNSIPPFLDFNLHDCGAALQNVKTTFLTGEHVLGVTGSAIFFFEIPVMKKWENDRKTAFSSPLFTSFFSLFFLGPAEEAAFSWPF